jgi:hypothetical protein
MEIKSDTIRSAVWKVSIFNISVLFGQSFNKWNESILPMYEGCALLRLPIKIELKKKKKKMEERKRKRKRKNGMKVVAFNSLLPHCYVSEKFGGDFFFPILGICFLMNQNAP